MLAKTWHPRYWCEDGMFVQPKLNGIRAMYNNGVFMSRDGLTWSPNCLQHLRRDLATLPASVVLDGELYLHGMSLQQINSRIAVTRTTPHNEEGIISYWVFDHVSTEGYAIRHAQLQLWLRELDDNTSVVPVPTMYIDRQSAADACFNAFKRASYEGLMYRHPHAAYSLPDTCGNKENRSQHLLKRKSWLDLDADVYEVIEGRHRLQGTCGSLGCSFMHNGRKSYFQVGSGLTDLQRRQLWELRDEILSASPPWTVKIQYEILSDDGVPLKPIILLVPNLV